MSVDKLENIIKNKLENFGETPPDYVFENIKSDFSKIKYPNAKAKYIKIASFITTAAIISSIVIYNIFDNNAVKNNNIKDNNTIISDNTNTNKNINPENNNKITEQTVSTTTFKNNSENKNKTIYKTIQGNKFNIKINGQSIISSSDNLIISKDDSYFYIKSNNFGQQNITLKNKDITINYIINFVKPSDTNDNTLLTDNKQTSNSSDNKETTEFYANFIVKSPTCHNNNGEIYSVLNNKNNTYSFIWNDNSKEQNRKNISSGKYTVTITDNNNVSKIYSINVKDSGIVKVAISHEELSMQTNYPIYFVNKTTIDDINIRNTVGNIIVWSFGDGSSSSEINPEHIYTNPGNYIVTLKVTSKEGCSDEIKYSDINISKTKIDVPNAFTPNGDGINDIFKLNVKSVTNFECIILDKSGKQIYKWTDPESGWDGKINGNNLADDGIYYYVAKGLDYNNKPFQKTGFFYLFKNR